VRASVRPEPGERVYLLPGFADIKNAIGGGLFSFHLKNQPIRLNTLFSTETRKLSPNFSYF
jgi:hypothetical protein